MPSYDRRRSGQGPSRGPSSYRREEWDDEAVPSLTRVKCWKCSRVGHPARYCTRISEKEELYEIDRVDPGIKFKLFKFTPVTVTTPLLVCDKCKGRPRSGAGQDSADVNQCKCTSPIDEFSHLKLDRQFIQNITDATCCNFEVPTPIQRYALPIISEGHDVMGCAQTGTGKTAAYIIPMVKFIKEGGYRKQAVDRKSPQRPEVLILAPTRELAMQIDKTTRKLTNDIEPSCGVCVLYGGVGPNKSKKQREDIRRGCNILIGTTGRIKQFLNDYTISLENIKFFVLDEADKMLDMGFGPDIDLILDARKTYIPSTSSRQSLMFSATFRPDLQEVARKSLKKEYRLVAVGGMIGAPQADVTQNFELVENANQKLRRLKEILLDLLVTGEKMFLEHKCWETEEDYDRTIPHPNMADYLLHMLGSCSDKKILVFVETRKSANYIADSVAEFLYDQCKGRFRKNFKHLYRDGDEADDLIRNFGAIHMSGELTQFKREEHLNAFKDGIYPIMVSTNVTARGIDIEGVTHVINFDLPQDLYKIPRIKDHDDQAVREGKKKPVRDQFEEYIHRIGRTGRAGNTGTAISFFQRDKDLKLAVPLVKMLSKAHQNVPDWLQKIGEEQQKTDQGKRGGGKKGGGKTGVITAEWDEESGPSGVELWGNEPL